MNLEGKTALITGASRGIGAALVIALAKQGVTVVGTATTTEGAEKITRTIEQENLQGKGIMLNISDPDSIETCLTQMKTFCGAPDILINNAGITKDNLMLRMRPDEWLDVINTNLNSAFYLTKQCLKPMMKAKWGRIINITSIVAYTGNPGQPNYCAAKAGLTGFSKSLALEIASRNITVNLIAPGFIDTDMTRALTDEQKTMILDKIPMKKIGKTEDIAHMATFLASNQASYITGQTFHVNGGMYMG